MPSQASSFSFRKTSASSSDCSTHFQASPHWALISDGIGISLPGNSASFAVFFHLHGSCGRRKRDNCGDHFFTHVFLFLPHTQKQDTGKPDIPFLLIFYLYEELPDYFAWIYPLAFRVSAQRTAPPAAPLTVL